MVSISPGKLAFNDPLRKFVFQEGNLKRLTEKYDLDVAVIGDAEKYLQVAVARAGELAKKDRFSAFRIAYDKIKAIDLREYVNFLVARHNWNVGCGQDISYYTDTAGAWLKEISKDVFEKLGK